MREAHLIEKMAVKTGFLGDLTGGQESERIAMDKSNRVAIVCHLESAAVDFDLTLRQHDAAAAGNSKDLSKEIIRYFVKLDGETKFTEKEVLNGAQIVDASLNGAKGIVIVEVLAEELDREGFGFISGIFTQGAVARVACVEYVAHQLKNFPGYDVEL